MPDNLEGLRISHCKMNWKVTLELMNAIKSRSFLKRLELIKVNLNEFSIKVLTEVVRTNRNIMHLDISWN